MRLFFGGLDRSPSSPRPRPRPATVDAGEDVGVAADEFLDEVAGYVVDREAVSSGRVSSAMREWKMTWKTRSPSSSRRWHVVARVDRLEGLVGLLQQVLRQALVGLLLVPRADPAEPVHHPDQVDQPRARYVVRAVHDLDLVLRSRLAAELVGDQPQQRGLAVLTDQPGDLSEPPAAAARQPGPLLGRHRRAMCCTTSPEPIERLDVGRAGPAEAPIWSASVNTCQPARVSNPGATRGLVRTTLIEPLEGSVTAAAISPAAPAWRLLLLLLRLVWRLGLPLAWADRSDSEPDALSEGAVGPVAEARRDVDGDGLRRVLDRGLAPASGPAARSGR